jgi:hypothetical protein
MDMTPEDYLTRFKEIYMNGPTAQEPVGHRPAAYLLAAYSECRTDPKLNKAADQLRSPNPAWPFDRAFKDRLSRVEVAEICRTPSVDPLVAYCFAMAWGIQWNAPGGYANFVESISDPKKLRENLSALRDPATLKPAGDNERQKAFQLFIEAESTISRLGISYYTKLIFFFLPEGLNGYILDRWTARAVSKFRWPDLITGQPKSGLGNTGNWSTAGHYEAYCHFVEWLAEQMPEVQGKKWTSSQAEQALFGSPDEGTPGKVWRDLIDPPKPKKTAQP